MIQTKYKLIPHNRYVSDYQKETLGDISTNDLLVDGVLLAEGTEVKNKSGGTTKITKEFLEEIKDNTNNWIKSQLSLSMNKIRNKFLGTDITNQIIPILKDHDEKVDNQVGSNYGLIRVENDDNGLAHLIVKTLITSLETKQKMIGVEGGLTKPHFSIHTNDEAIIREISLVTHAGAPGAGMILNDKQEPTSSSKALGNSNPSITIEESPEAIKLALESNIKEELVFIKNKIDKHLIISSLIKTGKVKPYHYEELFLKDISYLKDINEFTSGKDLLGVTIGMNRAPKNKNETGLDKANSFLESKGLEPIESDNPTLLKEIMEASIPIPKDKVDGRKLLQLMDISPDTARLHLEYELGDIEIKNERKDIILSQLQEQYLSLLNNNIKGI